MKFNSKFLILAVLLAALFLPGSIVDASSPRDDKVVFGGSYTLPSGSTLQGNLAVFGGTATLEKDSVVEGDVLVTGGTLDIQGKVTGNVAAFGGSINLGSNGVIEGDVSTLGGSFNRAEGAQVKGQVITGGAVPHINIPGKVTTIPGIPLNINPALTFFTDVVKTFLWSVALAALAMLLTIFVPQQTERVARAVMGAPVVLGGVGLLTSIVFVPLVVIMAVTIILIPVIPLAALLLILAGVFGWIAIGLETGQRLVKFFKVEWPIPAAAGLGTFLLTLVLSIIGQVPCVGWIAPFIFSIVALGAAILTRFGTQVYPPAATQTVAVTPIDAGPTSPVPPAS